MVSSVVAIFADAEGCICQGRVLDHSDNIAPPRMATVQPHECRFKATVVDGGVVPGHRAIYQGPTAKKPER